MTDRKRIGRWIGLLAIGLLPGTAQAQAVHADTLQHGAPLLAEEPALFGEGELVSYDVQPGETLYSVAARLGTRAYILYTLNGGLRAPLEAGQTLHVPARAAGAGRTSRPGTRGATYRVRRGDTLFGIGRQFGVSVAALQRANDLPSDAIRVDQVLIIPGGTTQAAVPGTREEMRWPVHARGPVLVYPDTFTGRLTASGRPYEPERFYVSHPELPFGTVLLLENPATGRSAFAEVVDRGPLDEDVLMDVSAAVARQLGLEAGSVQPLMVWLIE